MRTGPASGERGCTGVGSDASRDPDLSIPNPHLLGVIVEIPSGAPPEGFRVLSSVAHHSRFHLYYFKSGIESRAYFTTEGTVARSEYTCAVGEMFAACVCLHCVS